MKEVFISYSTKDLVQAETVRDVLEKNGISCWMAPQDIPGGSNYTKEIPNAIRGCKIFVLILSGNAQKSPWVLRELDSAVNSGKVILPFMLEDCDLNDEFNFLLTGAQRYAAYQKKAEALEKLVGRVQGVLGVEKSVPEAPIIEPDHIPASGPVNTASNANPIWTEQKYSYAKSAPENNTNSAANQQYTHKTQPVNAGSRVCPACKGTNIKVLPNKVKVQDQKEWIILIVGFLISIIAVSFIAFFMAGMCIEIAYALDMSDNLLIVGLLGGLIGGAVIASKIINKQIERKRLRERKVVECCQCIRCKKVFNVIKDL